MPHHTHTTFDPNHPGDQELETHFAFEEWADPGDRHTAVLLEDWRTPEGRELRAGDVITPNQARAMRVRFRDEPERAAFRTTGRATS